jgi:hypothetical protein
MPSFQGLPRAILVAISNVSGESMGDIEGDELIAELAQMGYEPDPVALYNTLRALRDDGGFVSYHVAGGGPNSTYGLMRLELPGRQEVEGWPASPGAPSSADIEELLRVLEARADDPSLPEPDRARSRAALVALRDLGVQVTAEVVAAWFKHLGL